MNEAKKSCKFEVEVLYQHSNDGFINIAVQGRLALFLAVREEILRWQVVKNSSFPTNCFSAAGITRLFCVRQSWRTLECWAALVGCWTENDNMSEKLPFFQTHWIDMRIGNTVGLGCGYKTGNGFNLLNSNIGQWQKNYLCGPKPNRIALHCIYE